MLDRQGISSGVRQDRHSYLDSPYYLSLTVSPDEQRVAAAIINATEGDGLLSIVTFDRSLQHRRIVYELETLLPVLVRYSQDGSWLAFAQGSTLGIGSEEAGVIIHRFDAPIQWIGFDHSDWLWCLARGSFTAIHPRGADAPRRDYRSVTSADSGSTIAMIRGGAEDLTIEITSGTADSDSVVFPWALEVCGNPQISYGRDAQHVFISADERLRSNRNRLIIARLDCEARTTEILLDETVSTMVGLPGSIWAPGRDGTVFVQFENGNSTRLFQIGANPEYACISPEHLEVFSFAPLFASSPKDDRICLIAADTREAATSSTRCLFIGSRLRDSWQFNLVDTGINDLPAWMNNTRTLIYVHDGGNGWRLRQLNGRHSCDMPFSTYRAKSLGNTKVACATSLEGEVELLQLHGPNSQKAGLLYIQGPHRQVLNGSQTSFFQHALFCILKKMADAGFAVLAINGPGSLGRGKEIREPRSTNYLDAALLSIETAVGFLHRQGISRYSLLAGSLGAYPAVRFLHRHPECNAAVLVSPAYKCDLAPLRGWDPLFQGFLFEAALADLAGGVSTPIFVAHGLRDEVVPSQWSSDFVAALRRDVPARLLSFPGEGHIFRDLASWRQLESEAAYFLSEWLGRAADH